MELEVSQGNDSDLLCEGTYSVSAVIDNKGNSLSMPFAATYEFGDLDPALQKSLLYERA